MQTNSLQVTVKAVAKPSTVYRLLSEPEHFTAWMGPGASIDPKSISVKFPNGDIARGHVQEMVSDKKISFSWGYDKGGSHQDRFPPASSNITIQVAKIETGTLVTLTHDNLPSEQEARDHLMGWRHFLGVLAQAASQLELGPSIESTVSNYLDAWNETDPVKRMQHIESCWESNAVYRDQMSYVDGPERLRDHIAGLQMMAPGARLEKTSGIDQCQGTVRFSWQIKVAGDTVVAKGTNFARLSVEGRFLSVTGFPA